MRSKAPIRHLAIRTTGAGPQIDPRKRHQERIKGINKDFDLLIGAAEEVNTMIKKCSKVGCRRAEETINSSPNCFPMTSPTMYVHLFLPGVLLGLHYSAYVLPAAVAGGPKV